MTMASRSATTRAKRPQRPPNGAGTKTGRARSEERRQASGEARRRRAEGARRRRKLWIRSVLVASAAVVVLLAVFLTGGHSTSSKYTYAVGSPGPGAAAPNFTLASNMGGSFNLAAQRGKTVLLFFQEGTDCQPCWTQLQAIQRDMAGFHHARIDEVASITTDSLGVLKQAASTYSTTIPVLSDPNLTVSQAYNANQYGMMGTSMDGHSFIVVGPSGTIEWRADYGGAPNYTMYVPVPSLLRQMEAGMAHRSAA